jgi:diguanylate cyclase (GGDEF)-like protein
MNNQIHRLLLGLVSSRAKRLLILLTLFLIGCSLYTYQLSSSVTKNYEKQHSVDSWLVYQLSRAYSELMAVQHTTPRAKMIEEIGLRYDIVWSRFEIILNLPYWGTMDAVHEDQLSAKELFSSFKTLDPQRFPLYSEQDVSRFFSSNEPIFQQVLDYVSDSFRYLSPLIQNQYKQSNRIADLQILLVVLTFLSFTLVAYIFAQESIRHKNLSLTDPLTGLDNRLALSEISEKLGGKEAYSCFMLDLNGFKSINDNYGHNTGDEILALIGKRLMTEIPCHNYQAFRIGGDEFALLLESTERAVMDKFARDIHLVFSDPFIVDTHKFTLSTSVGLACFPEDGENITDLLNVADRAMYIDKKSRKRERAA